MAKIHPFKAVRPTRDKAQLVSTRPLAAYRKHILRAKLDENPYTFLHIIHPEGDKEHHSRANSNERFEAVRDRFEDFVKEGILIQDEVPGFYIYRQTKAGHVFTGVIAGASIDEYDQDLIKKHEATITSRETMFTNYLRITGFNAEPVLLAHAHSEDLDQLLQTITQNRPEYEFSTTDKIKHELWLVQGRNVANMQSLFNDVGALYIADGHHRSASSARLKDLYLKEEAKHYRNHDFFLAYLIDEQKLEIVEFNRLVKHLNGHSVDSFLKLLEKSFDVEPLKKLRQPATEHEIICLIKKKAFSLKVKAHVLQTKDVVNNLDAQILTDHILTPVLGISDLKTSKDIEFVPGTKGLKYIQEQVKKDGFEVAFILYPVSMSEVKAVADEGRIMPPKSTWVEPKMRSGLTIYKINE